MKGGLISPPFLLPKERFTSALAFHRSRQGLVTHPSLCIPCRAPINEALVARQSRSGCSNSEQHATNDRNPNDLAA